MTTVDGELVAAIGENRKMVIFPLDQVPEMTRGRGVRLQRYKEKGLVRRHHLQGRRRPDLDRRRRPQLHAADEGTRGLARQPRRRRPHRAKGFPKNNKFARRRRRGGKAAAKTADD